MAKKADTPRRCAFCGGRRLSGEHVFPKWMQDVLKEPGKLTYSRINEATGRVQTWDDMAFKTKVDHVCHSCNHGWMSDLEGESKPILTPMLLGQPADLQPAAQEVVATWSIKTALVAQYLHGRDLLAVPSTLYERFYAEPEPLPHHHIWIGRFVGRSYATHYHHRALRLELPGEVVRPDEHNAYLTTFGVGQLVIQVLGHFLDEDVAIIGQTLMATGVQQVWPVQRPLLWPPGRYAFTEPGIKALANRLDTGGMVVRSADLAA